MFEFFIYHIRIMAHTSILQYQEYLLTEMEVTEPYLFAINPISPLFIAMEVMMFQFVRTVSFMSVPTFSSIICSNIFFSLTFIEYTAEMLPSDGFLRYEQRNDHGVHVLPHKIN